MQNYSGSGLAFQIGLLFLLKHKTTLFYLLSFVFICFITSCHSLSLIVIFCYSLSFLAIRCHSLSLVVSLVVIRCTTRFHSLSLVVICCITCCHSMSFYVPLVCFFINDLYFIIFCFLHDL